MNYQPQLVSLPDFWLPSTVATSLSSMSLATLQELNILFDRKNGLAPGKYYQARGNGFLRLDSFGEMFHQIQAEMYVNRYTLSPIIMEADNYPK